MNEILNGLAKSGIVIKRVASRVSLDPIGPPGHPLPSLPHIPEGVDQRPWSLYGAVLSGLLALVWAQYATIGLPLSALLAVVSLRAEASPNVRIVSGVLAFVSSLAFLHWLITGRLR